MINCSNGQHLDNDALYLFILGASFNSQYNRLLLIIIYQTSFRHMHLNVKIETSNKSLASILNYTDAWDCIS